MRAAADREWAGRDTDAAVMFATSREETRNADSEEYNVLKLSLDAQARVACPCCAHKGFSEGH